MNSPRPVTILTGFLGSGKTTLLNTLLKENHGLKIAVIINEFGDIGLDASLIEGPQDFVTMDNGCLCCAINEDLVKTLEKLKDREDYDAVVVETTGIADPLPVAWTFLRPQMESAFRFASILTVVDGLHLEEMLQKSKDTLNQIQRADLLYISKIDLCDHEQIVKTQKKLSSLNARAPQLSKRDKNLIPLLLEDKEDRWLEELDHLHDHQKNYMSLSLSLKNKKITLEKLEDLFEQLPKEIFRAKARFYDHQKNKTGVIHSVCGRIDFYWLDDKPNTNEALVLIGKDFDKNKIEAQVLQALDL